MQAECAFLTTSIFASRALDDQLIISSHIPTNLESSSSNQLVNIVIADVLDLDLVVVPHKWLFRIQLRKSTSTISAIYRNKNVLPQLESDDARC
jgi:hypothetical protein